MCFLLGFAADGSVAVVGLLAMDAVPDHMTGMAHGIACAWAQGMVAKSINSILIDNFFSFQLVL